MTPTPDLIARAQAGDEAAFCSLFESVRDFALAQARKHVPDQVEDTLQEMRLRLWQKLPQYRIEAETESFRAWASVLLRHVAIDLRRRATSKRRHPDFHATQRSPRGREPPWPDAVVLAEEDRERLSRLLDSIPSRRQRDALRLRYLEYLSYAEIARRLGVEPISCRVYVHRGLRRLRRLAQQRNLLERSSSDKGDDTWTSPSSNAPSSPPI